MHVVERCEVTPDEGAEHTYVFGSNKAPAFLFGNPGDPNDFFLVGSGALWECPQMPCISGRILNTDGEVIFSMVRNHVASDVYRVQWLHRPDSTGYDVVGEDGETYLSVRSKWDEAQHDGMMLTTITGTFYDKTKSVVAIVDTDKLVLGCRGLLGVNAFKFGEDYSEGELGFVRAMVASRGRINRMLVGTVEDKSIDLGGAFLWKTEFRKCEITLGDDPISGAGPVFRNSQFHFEGYAKAVLDFWHGIKNS